MKNKSENPFLIFPHPHLAIWKSIQKLLSLKDWHALKLSRKAKFGSRGCLKVNAHEAPFPHDSQLDASVSYTEV